MRVPLNRFTIEAYLALVGEKLAERGIRGKITIAGGAALCLGYGLDRTTGDIDAIFEPCEAITEISNRMTAGRGLEPGWLNDGAAGYIGRNPPVIRYKSIKGLDIDIVSPEYLLAMKIRASRQGHNDLADTEFLLRLLKVGSKEKAAGIFTRYFPGEALPEEADIGLDRAFANIIEPALSHDTATEGTEPRMTSEGQHAPPDDPPPDSPQPGNRPFKP
jgi:hypothetical protein